jgi:hypothetical protein
MQTGSATYQCLNCRLAQRAEIRVVSLPSPEVHRRRPSANSAMAMLLALKRCPRCGHYDRTIAEYNRHTARVAEIAYLVVLAVVAGSLLIIPQVPVLALAIVVGVAALGFVALVRRMKLKYPSNAESRVTLVGSTPLNQKWW